MSTAPAARTELRQTGRAWIARIRVGALVAFTTIAAAAAYDLRKPQWAALVPLLAGYLAFAVLLAVLTSRRGLASALTAWAFPLVDVPIMFVVQRAALHVAPSPGYVVGWSIGMWMFTLLVSTLTFDAAVVWATALCGAVAQAGLVLETHLGVDLVATSATMLCLSALVMSACARVLVVAVERHFDGERARVEAEQRAESLRREHEAVRSWTELVVHDLKQPLAGVISLADLCSEDLSRGRGDAARDVQLLRRELRRLDQMVVELVMLSRLEEGVLRPQLSDEELLPLLERVRDAHAADAAARGIALEVSGDPAARARVDQALIVRALENLLSNALRFAGPGHRVRLQTERAGGAVALSVKNNGPRVPREVRESIFDKRATSATDHRNAGLGLYFCRLIAEAHGGAARLVESADWNVDFRLELPGG